MSLRPWLIATVLLVPAAAGCLQAAEEDEADPFAVVTVTGEIVERGEEREYHPCGRPLWSAGLSTDARRLTVLEHHMPEKEIQLALWDDVEQVQAGNFTACEWPLLGLAAEATKNWTLRHRDLERIFRIDVREEALAVGETILDAGESQEIVIDRSPEGSDYTYEGEVTFTFHGLWPAGNLETVADEEAIRGSQGVLRTW